MIQKAAAMGNWWLAASSQQCAHSCIKPHAEFSGETSNNPGDSSPYSPELVPCDIQLFPKLKSPLKGKRFRTIDEIQENMTRPIMAIGRTVWVLKYLLWRGLRCHCPMYNVSCILYLLQKSLYFSYYMAGDFLERFIYLLVFENSLVEFIQALP